MNTPTVAPNAKKILVVDDNQVILSVLTLVLQPKGYKILTALSGPETLGVVRKEKPDLILIDLSFPPDPMNVGGHYRTDFSSSNGSAGIEKLRESPSSLFPAPTRLNTRTGRPPQEWCPVSESPLTSTNSWKPSVSSWARRWWANRPSCQCILKFNPGEGWNVASDSDGRL